MWRRAWKARTNRISLISDRLNAYDSVRNRRVNRGHAKVRDQITSGFEKDLAEFQEEAKTGSDPEVKKFAEDTAKIVQEHLDLAKETQSKLQ
jgi:Domain of unknown function (DUF4142)